jgi:hypothetical protein
MALDAPNAYVSTTGVAGAGGAVVDRALPGSATGAIASVRAADNNP